MFTRKILCQVNCTWYYCTSNIPNNITIILFFIFNICTNIHIYNRVFELGSILRLILLDSINYTLICTMKVSTLIVHNRFTWQKFTDSSKLLVPSANARNRIPQPLFSVSPKLEYKIGILLSITFEDNNWSITILDASPIVLMQFWLCFQNSVAKKLPSYFSKSSLFCSDWTVKSC